MRRLKTSHILGIVIVVFLALSFSSCATQKVSKAENRRRGLMLMDKSQYTMNKGKWKGSKDYKVKRKHRKKKYRKVYRK